MINSVNKEEDKIIINAYRDKNPGVYYLYDVKKDKLIKIADIKPWINEEEMAEIKPIKYTSRNGLTIHGYLTIPKGVEVNKLPVVVFPHGGPWSRKHMGIQKRHSAFSK
jgi:dipeptidyl aminopeptidase/acylaminoacyl peptidase